MRFLIAGLGSIGRRHLRNLVALGERDIVLYRTGQSTLPDDDLQGFPVEYDLESALGRHPDAVIVSNPTARHLDVAIPAARAGCHLLIEKPVSHSMARTDELRRAAADGGARILVGYQYRFHPALRQVGEWLEAGGIGEIVTAHAEYGEFLPGWHPWEDHRLGYSARRDLGGGALLTLSHAVDTLLWLLGPARLVAARTRVIPEIAADVDSVATLLLEFEGSVTGTVGMDYLRTPKTHRLEVVGTRGSATWDEGSGTAVLRRPPDAAEMRVAPPAGYDRNDLFMAEMAHFLRIARGEEDSRCPLDEGLRTLRLVSDALNASWTRIAGDPPRTEEEAG